MNQHTSFLRNREHNNDITPCFSKIWRCFAVLLNRATMRPHQRCCGQHHCHECFRLLLCLHQYRCQRQRHCCQCQKRCEQRSLNEEKIKTKTTYVYNDINNGTFSNEALPEIMSSNKVDTKTIILARCGMLECGKNFKGTVPEICRKCGEEDDESHRLNRCVLWKHLNFSETAEKIDFGTIYDNDYEKLSPVIKSIQNVWEMHCGSGSMRKLVA